MEELVVKSIPTLNDKTVIEMLKVLNTLVPAVASDSTVQNVYVQIRKAVKATHGEDSVVGRNA